MNQQSTKSERKIASAAAEIKGRRGEYEDTGFGRRRIGKVPRALVALISLVGVPILFLYRRLHRPRGA